VKRLYTIFASGFNDRDGIVARVDIKNEARQAMDVLGR